VTSVYLVLNMTKIPTLYFLRSASINGKRRYLRRVVVRRRREIEIKAERFSSPALHRPGKKKLYLVRKIMVQIILLSVSKN
jgi:heme exporter protein D